MTQAPRPGQPEEKKKPQKQGSWIGTIIFLVFVLARPAMSLLQHIQGLSGAAPLILIGVAALVGVGVVVALVVRRINASGPAAPDIAQYTARSSYPTQSSYPTRSSYPTPSTPRYPSAQRLPPPSPAPKPPQLEPIISAQVMIVGAVGLALLGLLAIIILIPQAGI